MSSRRSERQFRPDELAAACNLKKLWGERKQSLHLTQTKAAQILGFQQSAVSQYLNGKISLNSQAVLKFAKVLQVNPAEIDPRLTEFMSQPEGVQRITVKTTSKPMTLQAPEGSLGLVMHIPPLGKEGVVVIDSLATPGPGDTVVVKIDETYRLAVYEGDYVKLTTGNFTSVFEEPLVVKAILL
jgi:transcriptional regulator with XRE-family HTH domain